MTEQVPLDPEVIEMLLEDLPLQHRLFQEALVRGDCTTARQQVHSIAGAAAFCQFTALADAARAIESSLHKEDGVPSQHMLQRFDEAFQQVMDALSYRENPKENEHG